ncbi:MAG: Eco57I restriction-modification methylase domain-containing protein [Bacteroidaceae bacterium]|nr:Eco57I restriction-modification methylase domain-containing protein [Bacteroidaceae bacterium]
MLFQKNILRKYLALLPAERIDAAWSTFQSYFLNADIQQNILQSKEEQFQEGFLRELFVKVLGYTLNPSPDFNLITEQKNETNSKKADGAILIDGKVVGVIELKDHKTPDLSKVETQAFGYKNQHPDARLVVISNFEKLRLYIDNTVEHIEWNLFTLTEQEFREMYLCLAFEQVKQETALKMKQESVSSEDQITKALYKDYSQFKRALFADIVTHNPDHDQLLLFKKTQKLLDRLLFIFFAEDCALLPPNSMMQIINWWEEMNDHGDYFPFYERIKKYFGYMNTGFQGKKYEIFAYNGGLFKPDEVLDNIQISDAVLVEHTKRLSEYDFESEVDVNILGHIFENSLSEIEEVTQQINNGETPTVSKRKQDGVFYTPQYITKYIVENTVGRLCAEKKQELGIDEAEYFADAHRQKQTKIRLLDKLTQYRDWLKQITILDPACGSGAFLNAALRFLIDEHHKIDVMEAKVTESTIVYPDIDKEILEHNLFGVDINEESVEIAQLALWLRTAQPRRKLNTLNENIKCGNSLISDPAIAGDKAFDWQKEFPQVFAKGGFDVVIGNPPYLRVQGLRESHNKESIFYEQHYLSATGRFDFYVLFIERGFSLLNKNGLLSFILPHKFINADFGVGIRSFIYNNKALNNLVSFGSEQVFSDASVYTCVIGLSYGNSTFKYAKAKPSELQEGLNNYSIIPIENLADTTRWSLQSDEDSSIIAKLNKQPLRFKEITKACSQGTVSMGDDIYMLRGSIEGNFFIGFSEQIQKSVKLEKEMMKPILKGEDIKRYAPLDNSYWLIYPHHSVNGKTVPYEESEMKELFPLTYEYLLPFKSKLVDKKIRYKTNEKYWYALHRSREISLFETPKIITAEISLGCNMTYDTKEHYHNTQCYSILFDGNHEEYTLAYLTILNSKILWFFLKQTGNILRGGYFRFKTKYLEPFPLPDLSSSENKDNAVRLSALADPMLSLNEQLQEKRSRFLRRLGENLEGVKITTALRTFDQLDFAGFMAELKKQKIKLSLSQQDEWEEYFNKNKEACQALAQQISETDQEIDSRVFDLYGLTPEERQTVLNT